jgi:protein-arginine kinase activator protein McsA
MSGHCDFCGVWHSGSCSHPGRQWKERAERAEARVSELMEAYKAATKVELHYAKAAAERDALRALLDNLHRAIGNRHYGRMPEEVQKAYDAAGTALREGK